MVDVEWEIELHEFLEVVEEVVEYIHHLHRILYVL